MITTDDPQYEWQNTDNMNWKTVSPNGTPGPTIHTEDDTPPSLEVIMRGLKFEEESYWHNITKTNR